MREVLLGLAIWCAAFSLACYTVLAQTPGGALALPAVIVPAVTVKESMDLATLESFGGVRNGKVHYQGFEVIESEQERDSGRTYRVRLMKLQDARITHLLVHEILDSQTVTHQVAMAANYLVVKKASEATVEELALDLAGLSYTEVIPGIYKVEIANPSLYELHRLIQKLRQKSSVEAAEPDYLARI